ncbi:hypothetical protein SAMN02746041_02760 [Desulfacinum hydrothermale DSM 13146]|uniref:Uncharacterized protein n=1 Tax=Desulfacinum hydrothermale DSM 13146 TaxID=1121390 RepID=A0A1W1XS16_9BACT|nr:hypothetical protein [Desulfacinum hydrothermale]SMC26770.1 hypothetical protein SAMN02746041_02760 [Desulfacinum hydrothermale DSM 13146]
MDKDERFDADKAASQAGQGRKGPRRRRHPERYVCSTCGTEQPFCWTCPCGFMICSDCMEENLWGMTCNGITWTCPDCGAIRGFGNQ